MTDWLLEILIKLAESAEKEEDLAASGFQVTLCVGGTLISGNIISAKRYLQKFVDGAIYNTIKQAQDSGRLQKPDAAEHRAPEFIHLANARFLLGAHDPIPTSSEGVLWRCRLDRIDGFNMGEFRSLKD